VLRLVLDTNVLVSALRSRQGASFQLVSMVGTGRFETCLSVPLVLEYEDVLQRQLGEVGLNRQQVGDLIDYLCQVGIRQEVFYLWRPLLRDPKDDLVLELAVAARCQNIVTFNTKDFAGCERFGIETRSPQRILVEIGAS
jgi:putative PIN family toxin of toxin-antitoxin system